MEIRPNFFSRLGGKTQYLLLFASLCGASFLSFRMAEDPFWAPATKVLFAIPILLSGLCFTFKGSLVTSAFSLMALLGAWGIGMRSASMAATAGGLVNILLVLGFSFAMLAVFRGKPNQSNMETARMPEIPNKNQGILAEYQRFEKEKEALAPPTMGESKSRVIEIKKTEDLYRESAATLASRVSGPLGELSAAFDIVAHAASGESRSIPFSDLIKGELKSMQRMLDRYRFMVQPREPFFGENDFNAIALKVVEAYKKDFPKVRFDFNPSSQKLPVKLREEELGLILASLLDNALESGPAHAGGLGRIGVKLTKQTGKAVLCVEDEGTGIPNAIRDRIFAPFFSTKENHDGLGLAICYRCVKDIGGNIAYSSKPPSGTAFKVLLPLSAGPERPLSGRKLAEMPVEGDFFDSAN